MGQPNFEFLSTEAPLFGDERCNVLSRRMLQQKSTMSARRHAHPIKFRVRVSRDKFDRDAGSLVLQPSLVTVNGEVFVEYEGTLPLLHARWKSREEATIRTEVYDHYNDYKQIVSTSVDMKIISNSKVVSEIIDLTQESKTIEIVSEDDDENLNNDTDEQYRQTERRSSMFGFANYLQFPPSHAISFRGRDTCSRARECTGEFAGAKLLRRRRRSRIQW